MSKLPAHYQFVDLSDYGRYPARIIALYLKETFVTPIHITSLFVLSGLTAIFCIIKGCFFWAGAFLILKSILDAADGELSRIRQTPSYVGRYYDSISDIVLNFLFLSVISYVSHYSYGMTFLAFAGMQLQGTLYNYYYVILRNKVNGDPTSRIFEDKAPEALKGESQKAVNIFYNIYNLLYISFDKIIYWTDKKAMYGKPFPRWFMTLLSSFGLGFQLLIMAVLLALRLEFYIIPFFIIYSFFIFVFVGIRRCIL
jgi:hypothetical protein